MDIIFYLKAIISLGLVLGLIWLLSWASKHFLKHYLSSRVHGKRRLNIIESLMIDAKRRVVIVQIDNNQHALLLGQQDLLIDSNLTPPHDVQEPIVQDAKNV
tara:strand:- start:431 stop:736 length:306 start_codon:yes stop_codon:yes gene_type:complete